MAMTRNRYMDRGQPANVAIVHAAQRRFRPIFLTGVTTFLGLGPMIFETNEQALFLVPMAISLGLGTLASSIVVLILVPVAFIVIEEIKGITAGGKEEATPEVEPELAAASLKQNIRS